VPSFDGRARAELFRHSSGRPTVAHLAARGARVYLAARSTSRADEAIKAIKAEIPTADIVHLQLDLADLNSVKKAAEEFLRLVVAHCKQ
jgi:NAD(P)-dependent dehydrogenase (short-subunit alcohol dehydrogenase family)